MKRKSLVELLEQHVKEDRSPAARVLMWGIAFTLISPIITGLLFALPTIFLASTFGFESYAQWGDLVGGLTTPVVSLTAAILLYLTLHEQNKSQQGQQREAALRYYNDLINRLEDQLRLSIGGTTDIRKSMVAAAHLAYATKITKSNTYSGYYKKVRTHIDYGASILQQFQFIADGLSELDDSPVTLLRRLSILYRVWCEPAIQDSVATSGGSVPIRNLVISMPEMISKPIATMDKLTSNILDTDQS